MPRRPARAYYNTRKPLTRGYTYCGPAHWVHSASCLVRPGLTASGPNFLPHLGLGMRGIVGLMEQLPLWDITPPATVRKSIPLLSKSRFGAGLQCHKRLYLELYSKDLAEPWDPMTKALFEMGRKVGLTARGRFAGGVVANEDYRQHDEAVLQTAAALREPGTKAISTIPAARSRAITKMIAARGDTR